MISRILALYCYIYDIKIIKLFIILRILLINVNHVNLVLYIVVNINHVILINPLIFLHRVIIYKSRDLNQTANQ